MRTNFKDHFSVNSARYASFRPGYPTALFEWLAAVSPANILAWDCATGSGQAAMALARYFERVLAGDASASQIVRAIKHQKVEYLICTAENMPIGESSLDLVTVAQALHWFDQAAFFEEIKRVLKPRGVLAAWTYNLLQVGTGIDELVEHFCYHTLANYWPPERTLVNDNYRSVQLPFEAISAPVFSMHASWNLDQLLGYLSTWSAAQRYLRQTGADPMREISSQLAEAWGDSTRERLVEWPLTLLASRKD